MYSFVWITIPFFCVNMYRDNVSIKYWKVVSLQVVYLFFTLMYIS